MRVAARSGREPAVASGPAVQNVHRFLIVGSRGDDLPRRIEKKAIEPLLVDPLRHQRSNGSRLARPLERARETTVENQQEMPAGQRIERALQVGHRHERLHVGRIGVGRHQVARRPIVAICGDAVSGEIEDDPVVGLDQPGHGLAEQTAQRRARHIEHWRVHGEVLLPGQHLRQPAGVVDGCLQGRDLFVGVDPDDEGVVPREGQRGVVFARGSLVHRCDG